MTFSHRNSRSLPISFSYFNKKPFLTNITFSTIHIKKRKNLGATGSADNKQFFVQINIAQHGSGAGVRY